MQSAQHLGKYDELLPHTCAYTQNSYNMWIVTLLLLPIWSSVFCLLECK